MRFHCIIVVLTKMSWYYFYVVKYNTNLTALYEICSAQAPQRDQSKFVKCFMVAKFDSSPPQKNPSCQRIITQLSTDVTFHVGKEEPNLQKNPISKFTSAWIWEKVEGKEKKKSCFEKKKKSCFK